MSIKLLNRAETVVNNSLLAWSPPSSAKFREMLATLFSTPAALPSASEQQKAGKRGPEDQSGSSGGSSNGDRNTGSRNKRR